MTRNVGPFFLIFKQVILALSCKYLRIPSLTDMGWFESKIDMNMNKGGMKCSCKNDN